MQTLSKNKISHIASLQQKKYRTEYHEFLVEGTKSVEDFLRSGFEPSIVVIAQEELLSIFDVKEEIVFFRDWWDEEILGWKRQKLENDIKIHYILLK